MRKKVLVFDFDEVLVRTEPAAINYLNERYSINMTTDHIREGKQHDQIVNEITGLNLSFEEFYLDFTMNCTMSIHRHKYVHLLQDAEKVIPEISKKYNLFISTARNSLGREVIDYVLKNNNVRKYFIGIHFAYCLNENKEFIKNPKAKFIASFKGSVEYFFDDSKNEIEATKNIVPSVLFNEKKFYAGRDIQNIWTVNNWPEIGELVL